MVDMFTNYRLTPENYIPCNRYYTNKQPPMPKYPLVAYDGKGDPIGFTWNYGDSICLEFNTTGNVVYDAEDTEGTGFIEDAETYLTAPVLAGKDFDAKVFQVLIYNFRYEVVAYCELPAATKVQVFTSDFCSAPLAKGIYKLRLNLLDNVAGIQHTLIPTDGDDACTIFIK